MDLRFLILGAVISDLVDTPIGLGFYGGVGAVRLVAHALVLAAAVMVVVLVATRRGRVRKRWMALSVGILIHLMLDAMWADPETLWWPLLGWDFTAAGPATAPDYVRSIVTDWRVWVMEAAGLAYLLYLARLGKLNHRERLSAFFATGRIDVPIERRRHQH